MHGVDDAKPINNLLEIETYSSVRYNYSLVQCALQSRLSLDTNYISYIASSICISNWYTDGCNEHVIRLVSKC